jgi:hypothetical protein
MPRARARARSLSASSTKDGDAGLFHGLVGPGRIAAVLIGMRSDHETGPADPAVPKRDSQVKLEQGERISVHQPLTDPFLIPFLADTTGTEAIDHRPELPPGIEPVFPWSVALVPSNLSPRHRPGVDTHLWRTDQFDRHKPVLLKLVVLKT